MTRRGCRIARFAMTAIPVVWLLLVATSPADAKDHVIPQGSPWPSAKDLAPGDRVLLEPGLHDARTIEDWPGDADAPITIRSLEPEIPAAIAGLEGPALTVRRCPGIRLESLYIVGGGVRVDGDGTDSVTITDLVITPRSRTPGTKGPDVGLRIGSVDECRIDGIAVQRWAGTGLEFVDIDRLQITRIALAGDLESPVGVRLENCREAAITDGGIMAANREAVDIRSGTDRLTSTRLEGLVFERPGTPARVSPGASVTLAHCTVIQPRTAIVDLLPPQDPDREPARSRITIDRCLTVWDVGRLASLFPRPAGSEWATYELGPNLWWSPELPAILPVLGGFPGDPAEQRMDLDPNLVKRTWLPNTAAARKYGHGAGPDKDRESSE